MILSYSTTSNGPLTLVTVVSSLTGVVYYNWFQDGVFLSRTTQPEYPFALLAGQQANVVCIDSNSRTLDDFSDDFSDDFGWDSSTVEAWPSTRSLFFVRSLDPAIQGYQVQQSENGGGYSLLGVVADDPSRWSFSYQTGPLDDLATYAWQIVPVGQNGNLGTAVALAAETIVRTPDAPNFTVTVNGSQHLVFAAAAA